MGENDENPGASCYAVGRCEQMVAALKCANILEQMERQVESMRDFKAWEDRACAALGELGEADETDGRNCQWKDQCFKQMKLLSKAEAAILDMMKENKKLQEETREARKVRDELWAKLSMAREEVALYLRDGAGEEGGFRDLLAAIDGEVEIEVVRVKVVEAEGYVCGLEWMDDREQPCIVGYGYSYWNLMRPRPEHGDEIVMLILRKKD